MKIVPDAEQPTFFTNEENPHIVFTPYVKELVILLALGVLLVLGHYRHHQADGVLADGHGPVSYTHLEYAENSDTKAQSAQFT